MERSVQHLYPVELSCDVQQEEQPQQQPEPVLNIEAPVYVQEEQLQNWRGYAIKLTQEMLERFNIKCSQ